VSRQENIDAILCNTLVTIKTNTSGSTYTEMNPVKIERLLKHQKKNSVNPNGDFICGMSCRVSLSSVYTKSTKKICSTLKSRRFLYLCFYD